MSAAAAPGAALSRLPPGTGSRCTRPLPISFLHAPSRSLRSEAESVQAIGGVSSIAGSKRRRDRPIPRLRCLEVAAEHLRVAVLGPGAVGGLVGSVLAGGGKSGG